MSIKGAEVHSRDTCQEPTELRLIGYSTESIWTPRSKSNMLTPKTQLAVILTKGNFTRDEWEHLFVFVQHQPFQFHQWSWGDVEENTRRCRKRCKIKADDQFGITIQREGSERASLDCIGKPGENQIWKSERTSELVKCAANKYGETRSGR